MNDFVDFTQGIDQAIATGNRKAEDLKKREANLRDQTGLDAFHKELDRREAEVLKQEIAAVQKLTHELMAKASAEGRSLSTSQAFEKAARQLGIKHLTADGSGTGLY